MRTNLHATFFSDIIPDKTSRLSGLMLHFLFTLLVFTIHQPVFCQNAPNKTEKKSSGKDVPVSVKKVTADAIRQSVSKTLKTSSNNIWFEKNDGQFGNDSVIYGFRTSFGSMGVYCNKLRVVTQQTENGEKKGKQIVDITFPGSIQNWVVLPGSKSAVKGSYNNKCGTIHAAIFNEITLKNVYPGIDLRLYSGEQGALEFDWLLAKAADHKKIRMNFKGQHGITIEKNGEAVIQLQHDNMKIVMPETYQILHGQKKLFEGKMSVSADNNTLKYDIAGNINPNLPLVIDPVMLWSTYVHNNTSTFDEYLYTIAVNAASEVYACGLTNEAISTAYMSGVAPGFLSTYNFALNSNGGEQSSILYRLNAKGTVITAWTYTGLTKNIPVALGIFPDNRILVVYKTDTIQIFSADLTTRLYSDDISPNVGNNVLSYQSQSIIDNDVFYLGGVAETALPASIIPATAPDAVLVGNEGIILRINNATTIPFAQWGTYVGGSSNESFTAIAATPDKTKIAFAVHVDGSGGSYPALVNAVDNTISGTELLVGVIPVGTPSAFSFFSYLGGSLDEGKSSKNQNAALVAADNNYFYVAGNTTSSDFPNTAGSAQPTQGAGPTKSNQFLSQIPLNGSAGVGFKSTYNGGSDVDIVGGLVIDSRTNDVILFGTTQSNDFPVYNASLYSPFYQASHGSFAFGKLDITYSVFANGLATRKFSTYIGGDYNDYLGSTGKLEGTGHFQYNSTNGFTYIGTTIHSDQSTLPSQWMSSIPGFDKSIPPASASKDNHFIFAMSPNTDDFGDAPASYDAGTPASSAVSFFNLRIGDEADAEERPNSSLAADGDDILNSGSTNDEDGLFSIPSIVAGATSFSVTVSVFNSTGATVKLYGWIDTDGNGIFDTNEYAAINVPSSASQQSVVLNFSGLPPFFSAAGYSYLRLRITNVTLTAANATGAFGKGEVEDHIVIQSLILPVLLEKFTAVQQRENVLLNWAVSKEINVQHYQVQYSTDNIKFTSLALFPAAGSYNYSWLHSSAVKGTNYYRLCITGTDGGVTYSHIESINFGKNNTVTVYPNPAKDIINIRFPAIMITQPATLSFLSVDGKVLLQKKINTLPQTETIDVSHYPEGQYLLRINNNNKVTEKKIKVTRHR